MVSFKSGPNDILHKGTIFLDRRGVEHPHTPISMGNIARIYSDQGQRITEAEKLQVWRVILGLGKEQLEAQDKKKRLEAQSKKKQLEVQVMDISKKLLAIPTSIYDSDQGPETPCNPGHGGTFIHTNDCASPTSEGQ